MGTEISDRNRRMLMIATGSFGGIGVVATMVPFVESMAPSEAAKAAGAPVEVDIGNIPPGKLISVEWRGKPVWILHRSEFIEAGKPVLGICRGCQLINVAFGGTLYQDIATEVPTAIEHVNVLYDLHYHALQFTEGSSLKRMLSLQSGLLVNTIHHQAVKTLGRDIVVEAVSGDDNMIEAIRYCKASFVVGLQWHPEFHQAGTPNLLDCTPILDSFLRAARNTRF